jgi:peptide deformylase
MAIRPIVLYPDPVLLRATSPVERIDDEIRTLVRDMTETMYAAPGIGLAANQVGVSKRVCIVDLTAGEEPDHLLVLVNPQIVHTEGADRGEEGCLSFPDITLEIERPQRLTVRAMDLDGETYEIEASELLARAIAHECEHLDGQVFLRNVSALRRERVKREIRRRMRNGDWAAAAVE